MGPDNPSRISAIRQRIPASARGYPLGDADLDADAVARGCGLGSAAHSRGPTRSPVYRHPHIQVGCQYTNIPLGSNHHSNRNLKRIHDPWPDRIRSSLDPFHPPLLVDDTRFGTSGGALDHNRDRL
ncbi:hypothetical protein PGTUg99_035925 [Puccinia graminis f. sp. tritici]|uniref:Uncharacterized protein n=1 Tax=Puccinia graminis f. sp. tritici TaxID=56615 RepID=A0A5B0SFG8_PUCGR|nr:hypothetical protein PGTUg99_035925 [Puccinia graminis f. sp. tritici]